MTARILLVEDDDLLRELLEMALSIEGFDVSVAEEGQQGLERVCSERFDLVLLDLMMPLMDGFGFMQLLGERVSDPPPVLVLSASGTAAIAEKVLRAGACGVVRKPVDTDELIRAIHKTLAECATRPG